MSSTPQPAGKLDETASGLPVSEVLYIPIIAALVALVFLTYITKLTSTKNKESSKATEAQSKETAFPKIYTEIEIAAPPDVVRSKFLDFSTIPQYQRPGGYVGSLAPPAGKTGVDLQPGDQMKATLGGMNITLEIVENNETTFSWYGAWPSKMFNLLAGIHTFSFVPSPSSTTSSPVTIFRQYERHEGIMSGVMSLGAAINKANEGNMGWNEDLKKWVEGGS